MTVRCDTPESPGWVRPARQVLIYLLQYVWYMLLMMMMMIVMMIMVNFKRICPKDFREEFLVGRMAVRCDPLESPGWVRPARQVLIYLLLFVWYMLLMMMMMIVMMIMVNFKRICQKTSGRSVPRWDDGPF